MIIENGKITKCTETELYTYWLKRYSDILSFPAYKLKMKEAGMKII